MTGNPELFLSRTGYRQVTAGFSAVLTPGADINGVLFTGASNIIVTAAAGTLTGTTLASNVVNSSLISLGNSASLPGNPTTTTQPALTDNTTIATTAYVDSAVASTPSAPTTLTGDVTGTGTGTISTVIANGVVTGAMLSGTGAVRDFGVTVTGNGSSVTAGTLTATITVPMTGTITKWYLSCDIAGSIVMDVLRGGVSIIGTGNNPTLTSATSANASVSGWTSVAISTGDVITFNITSVSILTSVTLVVSLNVT